MLVCVSGMASLPCSTTLRKVTMLSAVLAVASHCSPIRSLSISGSRLFRPGSWYIVSGIAVAIPRIPLGPRSPLGPVGPCGPAGPRGPAGPCGPAALRARGHARRARLVSFPHLPHHCVLLSPAHPVTLERPARLVALERPARLVAPERPARPVALERPARLVALERPLRPVALERPLRLVALEPLDSQPWPVGTLRPALPSS